MKFRIHLRADSIVVTLFLLTLTRIAPASTVSSGVLLLSTPNPVVQGQNDTITGGVNWTATESPTGTITLTDTVTCPGATTSTVQTLGTITLGSQTSATPGAGTLVVTSFPCAGNHSIVGSYSGDSNYSARDSAPLAETVLAQFSPTSIVLTSSLNPSTAGQAVTLSAKLTSGSTPATNASGTITFIDTNTSNVLGTAKVSTAVKGNSPGTGASITITSLAAGSYAVEASYSGDNVFSPSTSAIVDQVVTGTGGPPPAITTGGVVSASQFGQFAATTPGGWIEIYGTNLASKTRSWATSDFQGVLAPTSLEGTIVTVGGQSAFIDYISPSQVNVQVPSNVPTGSQPVIVTTSAGASAPSNITVNAAEPGLLAPSQFQIGGKQYVGALFSDGVTYVLPPGVVSGVTSQRAKPGETITLYGVGFGSVIPNIPAGQIVEESNQLASSFQISFGGTSADLTFFGLAPQAIGLYQFNVVVPNVSANDLVPVTFTLGGTSGTQTLFIAIQN